MQRQYEQEMLSDSKSIIDLAEGDIASELDPKKLNDKLDPLNWRFDFEGKIVGI